MELWKDIPQYEGLYQVSNKGNVRSLDKKVLNNGGFQLVKGRVLKQANTGRNRVYKYVALSKNGKVKNKYIHRLVAETFITNPENKPTVDHIDRDTSNNTLENLRWATYKEQTSNADICNIQNMKSVTVLFEGKKYSFKSQTDCAKYFGTSKNRINELVKGKRSEYKGIKILLN